MKNLFLDFEFTGLRQNAEPISMCLVSELGDRFYAEFCDYDRNLVTDWVKDNVLPALRLSGGVQLHRRQAGNVEMYGDRHRIARDLTEWITKYIHKAHCKNFRVWVDVGAYDWVLFQSLFGGAFNMPSQIHYIPFDLAQKFDSRGLDADTDREQFLTQNISKLWHDSRFTRCGQWALKLPKHSAEKDAHVAWGCWELLRYWSHKSSGQD